jgi:ATP synthase protein I
MVRAAFKGGRHHFPVTARCDGVSAMAGNSGDDRGSESGSPPSDEATLSARRGQLDRRLSELRDSRRVGSDQDGEGRGSPQARASAMAIGLRLSSELVAGVLVGAVLGWGFDRLLSTSPWGLIVFLLLGFAAGVINVVRSSGAGRSG